MGAGSVRGWGVLLILSGFLAAGEAGRLDASGVTPQPRLGINLAMPKDWNTEMPFANVFNLSRPWVSQRRGAAWGQGPPLALDSHGWVTSLQPGCYAEAPLCTGGHYPPGTYTVYYQGEGKLVPCGATVLAQAPGCMQIQVPARLSSGFSLQLLETNPSNYIRNIQVFMPGLEKQDRSNPWNPQLLQRWQGVGCLRFMDFMLTNNSTISSWADRPQRSDATYCSKGVPHMLLIDLANRLGADPCFCIPHKADDDYVRNLAISVKQNLKPGLKAYIQYSNETWNFYFQQAQYAAQQGVKLGLASEAWQAAARYTSLRSVQIFTIWEQVFGGTDRLVRVLPGQAACPLLCEEVVSYQDAYKHADALAIAPYITLNVFPSGTACSPTTTQVDQWTLDDVFNYVRSKSLPTAISWIQQNKKVADSYGLKLVAYEGGQGLVGIATAVEDNTVTALLQAANADPRMGQVYLDYYKAWQDAGGDLLAHFNSVERWSRWGSWGLLQYQDDDPAKSPKFVATMLWAKSLGQAVTVPGQ